MRRYRLIWVLLVPAAFAGAACTSSEKAAVVAEGDAGAGAEGDSSQLGSAALVGSWHDADDTDKVLRFEADGTYFDSANFNPWTQEGYSCAGRYAIDGFVITLEQTCTAIDDAQPCHYTKDILAVAVADGSLSVTAFHRADGSTEVQGTWEHHTERWRPAPSANGSCAPTMMENALDMKLELGDGTFTYSIHTHQWDSNTSAYKDSDVVKDGTYSTASTTVTLDAPIKPMHLLGAGLAPGEKLYVRE